MRTINFEWKFFVFGGLLLTLSAVLKYFDPVTVVINNQYSLKPGTFLFKTWQKMPVEVYVNVYLFNITNSEEFLSGKHKKLQVSQIGPYVYQEFLEHKNVTFNKNGTISYEIHRHIKHVQQKTTGDVYKDTVYTTNVLLMGASTVAARHSKVAAYGFTVLAQGLNANPILNMTVHDLLWGYEDNMINLAAKFVPSILNEKKFGYLARMFDEGNNTITMHLPESIERLKSLKEVDELATSKILVETEAPYSLSDVEYEEGYEENSEHESSSETPIDIESDVRAKFDDIFPRHYSIDLWNGSPILPNFENIKVDESDSTQSCNKIQGAIDGSLLPSNITKLSKFKVYRKAFCRLLPIYFAKEGKLFGVDAYWFELSENAFYDRLDDPETKCFCDTEKVCLKKGLGNISPCSYGLPLAVSQPHFFKADPSLLNGVKGLEPNEELHQSYAVVQPQLGIAMSGFLRIQLNLVNENLNFNEKLKKFSDMTIPILWIEIAVEKLPNDLQFFVKLAYDILPKAETILVILCAIAGILLLVFAVFSCPKKKRESDLKFKRISVPNQVECPLLKAFECKVELKQ